MLFGVAGAAVAVAGYGYLSRPGASWSQASAPDGMGPSFRNDRAAKLTWVGYVPYWDQPNAFATVQQNPEVFDQVSPVWYSLDTAAGVVPADDQYARIDKEMVTALQSKGKKVIPTVTSLRNGDWQPSLVRSMLADSKVMDGHVSAIKDLVMQSGYDGIDIDYEDLKAEDRDRYSEFIHKLSSALHGEGKLLTSSVYAKDTEPGPNPHNVAQNYFAIGSACDQVRVMTFDYHYTDSPAGPVSPLDWVERVISWAVTQVPARKVMLGVVLLGYDWADGERGVGVSYQQATAIAQRNQATVAHTAPGDSPNFAYTDASGKKHHVWFEDAISTAPKLALVDRYGLGGAIFWRLGGEDPKTWSLPVLGTGR